jgi:hypothetical protein
MRPDCIIREFNVTNHGLSFSSIGIHVDGRGMIEAEAKILCAAPRHVHSRRFANGEWQHERSGSAEGLREICEWSVEGSDLRFAGFETVSGLWREYFIPAFSIRVIVAQDGGRVRT